jgi:hypothetical protein
MEQGRPTETPVRSKEASVTSRLLMTVVMAIGILTIGRPAVPQNVSDEKLHIAAWAVDMSNIGTGATAMVNFTIERWTQPEEGAQLIATMLEQGQDALLRALQKMPSHGRMRFPSWEGPDPFNARLGWDIRYTFRQPLPDGGRRIVMALDRYITLWEARERPRTIDYPFTVIEMRVNKDGEGEGKLSIATKINFDRKENVIELETYASEPVRLQNVKVQRKSS